jgi:hypothetical protein
MIQMVFSLLRDEKKLQFMRQRLVGVVRFPHTTSRERATGCRKRPTHINTRPYLYATGEQLIYNPYTFKGNADGIMKLHSLYY